MTWLREVLQGEPTMKFPVLFPTTRVICRLYEILTQQHQSYFVDPRPCDPSSNPPPNLLLTLPKTASKLTHSSLRDYLMLAGSTLGPLHLFEKVLYCLKEECFAMDMISQLSDTVSLPIVEVIRFTRLFQQDVQTVQMWPASLYKLICREDIISNLKGFEKG